MLAMLLATTSSSRVSAICRDSPTRTEFCIGHSPCAGQAAGPPEAGSGFVGGKALPSPKPPARALQAACQRGLMRSDRGLDDWCASPVQAKCVAGMPMIGKTYRVTRYTALTGGPEDRVGPPFGPEELPILPPPRRPLSRP